MIRILSLFTLCENVHLTKDVGMIPYILHNKFGYDATIASYNNGEYPNLITEVSGLKQVFVKRYFRNHTLDSLVHILLNSRKYDVLQCYHLTLGSILLLSVFKLLKIFNSYNVTYLKLDADDSIKEFDYYGKLKFFIKPLVKCIDLISIETKKLHKFLNDDFTLGREVLYVPNGFYSINSRYVTFEEKENIILTVGRIGTDQKSNETLLSAFKLFSKCESNWRLLVIGPIENSFLSVVNEYVSDLNLKDRISFMGAIHDREIIDNAYKKAKIFVLTSKHESFGLVYLEAMKAGCTIISTSIPSAYDVTDNGKYGKLFPVGDVNALAEMLINLSEDDNYLKSNCPAIQQFGYENFYWPTICRKINNSISDCLNK